MSSARAVREDFPRAFGWVQDLVQGEYRNAATMLRVIRELFRARGGSWLRRAWHCPIIKVSGRAGLMTKLGLSEKACRNAIANLVDAGVLVIVGVSGFVQTGTRTGVARTPIVYQFTEATIRQIDGSPDRFRKGRRVKPLGLDYLLTDALPGSVLRRWNGSDQALVEAIAKGFPDGFEENPLPLGARRYEPLEALPRVPEARRAVALSATPRVPLPVDRYSDEARRVEAVPIRSGPELNNSVDLASGQPSLGLRLSAAALKIFQRR